MPPAIIAAAIGVAGAAGTAVYSSSQAKKANNKALDAQTLAGDKQLADQKAARDQITQLQQPAIDARNSALGAILQRYGLNTTPLPAGSTPSPATTSKTPGGMTANYGTPQGGATAIPAQGAAQAPAAPTIDTEAFLKANPDVAAYYSQTPEAQKESLQAFADRVASEQADVRGPPPMTAAPAQRDQAQPAPYVPEYTRPEQAAWQGAGTAPQQADFLDPSKFTTSPGFEFRQTEAMRNLNSKYGASGLLKSGAALKGVTDYNQGAASAEFGNWFNQQNTLYQEALGQYNANRSANYNIFTGERNNANQNFADDRSYGTNLGLTNRTYDTAQATDARNNSQQQDQQRVSNLFGLVNNGTAAAASVAGASTNYANNAGNIYGNTANAQSDAAYGNAAANSQLVGSLGGIASSAVNLFSGTPRFSGSNTVNPNAPSGASLYRGVNGVF